MRSWLRTTRLLLGFAAEIGRGLFLAYVGVSVTALVAPLLLAAGLRPLVNGVVFDRTGQVVVGTVLAAAGLVLAVSAPAAYRWTIIRLRERSSMVMQRRLLHLATTAPRLEHLEGPGFWDRFQLLKRSTDDLSTGLTLAFVGPIVLAQLLVTAVLLGRLQPLLLLVPFVALPAAWLARWAEALRRTADLRTAEHRRAAEHLFALASEAAPGKEVRVYGLRAELLARHREAADAVHRGTEAAAFRSVAISAGGWLLFALAYTGAALVVVREAATGRATPGDVALTLGLATAVVLAANQLSALTGSVLRVRTASEHYHWLEQQQAATQGGLDSERGTPPDRWEHGIALNGVGFTYAGSSQPAIRDLSLRLPAGAVVAVVGENGAGKSTLVKLLCGMYAPRQGRVLVDGIDLETIDLEAYRERISAGFQDFVRFELVARESVGIGDLRQIDEESAERGEPALWGERAVRAALAKANATAFTERLPAGLETQLGLSWQGGVDLSGGEWQKLALARSLLRPDPLLMILDEPAAALDPQTEHALFAQVAADARRGRAVGRITVLISHRFSTVRMADLIVVLDGGRVAEQGTHDELVARAGLYAELYQLQARAYR